MRHFCYYAGAAAGLLLAAACPAAAQTTPTPAATTQLAVEETRAAPGAPAPLPMRQLERGVWKLGLNNFLLRANNFGPGTYYTRYGLHLAYERRLGRAWSAQAEASPALAHYRFGASDDIRATPTVRVQVQGRYYYNLERRLRRGRRPASFSANYLALALGTGFGSEVRETPFYLLGDVRGAVADVALLYGLQRRLGRRVYLDGNVGVSALGVYQAGWGWAAGLNGSLRLGLLLGAPPAPPARPVPADEVTAPQPRAYVGAGFGIYYYQLHYSDQSPYPPDKMVRTPLEYQDTYYPRIKGAGWGTYVRAYGLPYVYGGYHFTPRLAVQVGVQWSAETDKGGTFFDTPAGLFSVLNQTLANRLLALPVQVHYALTPVLQQRVQFEAVGGLTPQWAAFEFHEYQIVNQQVTSHETFSFRRQTLELHAALGLQVSCGFGRRRRVQATTELLALRDLRTGFFTDEPLQGGASLGLRYRFGYR